jgi:putative hydrolase of the HAD superfamily
LTLRYPKAILFDLDDTLIKGGAVRDLVNDFYRLHYSDLAEDCIKLVFRAVGKADRRAYQTGEEFLQVLQMMVQESGITPVAGLAAYWREHFSSYVIPEPGMLDVLDHLKSTGISIGVVTNGGPLVQGEKMTAVNLWPWLDCTVTCDEAGFTKPRPGPFLRALSTLQVAPEDTWFVGDYPEADIVGSQRVGMTPIWKQTSFPWDPQLGSPNIVITKLEQLISLLRASEEATA